MINWWRMVRVLIPLVAGCSLLVSLLAAIVTFDFLRDAKTTTGTIVASEITTGDDETVLYRPTFTFTVDEHNYSVTTLSYVSPSAGSVGTRVPLLYDPSRPSNARIDSFAYTWMLSTVTFFIGCVFGMCHLTIHWFTRDFRYVGKTAG